jgi:hypothetical protein
MGERVSHSNCIWVFFGQNMGAEAMKGRDEHIDQVYHSGTWHVQLAGTKVWNLRPNLDGEWPSGSPPPIPSLRVEVKAGEIIMINTRLWFHATELPCTADARDQLSLSYARDFHIAKEGEDVAFPEPDMCNEEGPISTRFCSQQPILVTSLLPSSPLPPSFSTTSNTTFCPRKNNLRCH